MSNREEKGRRIPSEAPGFPPPPARSPAQAQAETLAFPLRSPGGVTGSSSPSRRRRPRRCRRRRLCGAGRGSEGSPDAAPGASRLRQTRVGERRRGPRGAGANRRLRAKSGARPHGGPGWRVTGVTGHVPTRHEGSVPRLTRQADAGQGQGGLAGTSPGLRQEALQGGAGDVLLHGEEPGLPSPEPTGTAAGQQGNVPTPGKAGRPRELGIRGRLPPGKPGGRTSRPLRSCACSPASPPWPPAPARPPPPLPLPPGDRGRRSPAAPAPLRRPGSARKQDGGWGAGGAGERQGRGGSGRLRRRRGERWGLTSPRRTS